MAKPPGRKLKLTDEMQDLIVNAIAAGNFAEASAQAAGLPTSTFYRYMEIGGDCAKARAVCEEEGKKWTPATANDERLLAFWEAVTRARARAQVTAIAHIRKSMPDDWKAAAWYLERAFPKQYGKRLLAPEVEKDEDTITESQAKIVAEVLRATVTDLGMDADDPEVKTLLRSALESAAKTRG